MTHRIVVNCETGVSTQVEYTAEEQAAHDAAVVAQAQAQTAAVATPTETVVIPAS
jgi:hypothetical protein